MLRGSLNFYFKSTAYTVRIRNAGPRPVSQYSQGQGQQADIRRAEVIRAKVIRADVLSAVIERAEVYRIDVYTGPKSVEAEVKRINI
jgi:hypothetical protein